MGVGEGGRGEKRAELVLFGKKYPQSVTMMWRLMLRRGGASVRGAWLIPHKTQYGLRCRLLRWNKVCKIGHDVMVWPANKHLAIMGCDFPQAAVTIISDDSIWKGYLHWLRLD